MGKRKRTIGTTEDAIVHAEQALARALPASFRSWLVENNGTGIREANINIYPVLDKRDPRNTWKSIVRNYEEYWQPQVEEHLENQDADLSHLLPVGEPDGSGDVYCLDYRRARADGEMPVVRVSHETGDTEDRASSFAQFVEKASAGDYKYD